MQRFKKYVGKEILSDHVRNVDQIQTYGLESRYVPEHLEEFEECEFVTDFEGHPLVVCVTVLEGKVKRVMFVLTDQEDPEAVAPLTEAQLTAFLDDQGEQLVQFFEYITHS
jgi:hypothetical protein